MRSLCKHHYVNCTTCTISQLSIWCMNQLPEMQYKQQPIWHASTPAGQRHLTAAVVGPPPQTRNTCAHKLMHALSTRARVTTLLDLCSAGTICKYSLQTWSTFEAGKSRHFFSISARKTCKLSRTLASGAVHTACSKLAENATEA